MKIARMAILGIAVLAAGGAALMASNLARSPEQNETVRKDAPAVKLSEVLVAEKRHSARHQAGRVDGALAEVAKRNCLWLIHH